MKFKENVGILVIPLKVSEIVAWFLKIFPDIALIISFILTTTISVLVIKYYLNKQKTHEIEMENLKLECERKKLEIKNEELLLRKKNELGLK